MSWWTGLILPPTHAPTVPLEPTCCLSKAHVLTCVLTGLKLGAVLSPGVMATSLFPWKTSWGLALRLKAGTGVALVIPSPYQMLPDQH